MREFSTISSCDNRLEGIDARLDASHAYRKYNCLNLITLLGLLVSKAKPNKLKVRSEAEILSVPNNRELMVSSMPRKVT